MSTFITAKRANYSHVKQGILDSSNILQLLKSKQFPSKFFQEFLAILIKFEIAFPLDRDNIRILISALLPKVCPTIVKEQLDNTDCYRRVFTFFPEISLGHSYRCLIPPGLWGRLLSSIINNIKEVKDMLNQQVIIDISIPTDASLI